MKPCFNAIREQGERLECSSWCMRNRKNTRRSMRSASGDSASASFVLRVSSKSREIEIDVETAVRDVRGPPGEGREHVWMRCGSATRTGVGPQASRLRASHDASQYNVIVTRGSIHFAPRSPHRGKKPRVAPHAYANQTPLRCSQINLPHLTRAQRATRKKCVNARFP